MRTIGFVTIVWMVIGCGGGTTHSAIDAAGGGDGARAIDAPPGAADAPPGSDGTMSMIDAPPGTPDGSVMTNDAGTPLGMCAPDPMDGCPAGPACGSGCCGAGEQCDPSTDTCMCGSGPRCTGANMCAAGGPVMPGGGICGIICCGAPGGPPCPL
jgi:hypothetical protein